MLTQKEREVKKRILRRLDKLAVVFILVLLFEIAAFFQNKFLDLALYLERAYKKRINYFLD